MYEPIIEAHAQETDEKVLTQLIDNIVDMLKRPNWRKGVALARQQMPAAMTGSLTTPLADMLTQAESTEMMSAIAHINQLARAGHYRSAMEEAYTLMSTSSTYLPLHIHMGELLLRENRTQEAITKFKIVAETYSCRGEPTRATELLQRIVQIAPLDQTARRRLIDRFVEQGRVDEAIKEFISLADVNYRLAQLDNARSTYENALRLAQQVNADRAWSVRILHHMADIDLQRLDWRQALRVYEQLRTLGPDDIVARGQLVELNIRLGQRKQAEAELDNYLSYLSGIAKDAEALAFLEAVAAENQEIAFVRRRLAEFYQQAARVEDAIVQWDVVAKLMVDAGDNEKAKEAIRAILVLNPPNVSQYRAVLQSLG